MALGGYPPRGVGTGTQLVLFVKQTSCVPVPTPKLHDSLPNCEIDRLYVRRAKDPTPMVRSHARSAGARLARSTMPALAVRAVPVLLLQSASRLDGPDRRGGGRRGVPSAAALVFGESYLSLAVPIQFSIRSLLVLVVVAVPSSWLGVEMRRAKQQSEGSAAIFQAQKKPANLLNSRFLPFPRHIHGLPWTE